MKMRSIYSTVLVALLLAITANESLAEKPTESDAPLPAGVKAVWELGRAWHEETPTRQRICVNGLWRWQPADASAERDGVPAAGWGGS